MTLHIYTVDAFTNEPFKGNQAGVCLLEVFPNDVVLQQIAAEMNLAETAFLVHKAPLHYSLRWFTPVVEVNLCGHATLAATHVLFQLGMLKHGETVRYDTQSGTLSARMQANGKITLDFPLLEGLQATHPALTALGVNIVACEKNRDNYLVEVPTYQELLNCQPDFNALLALDLQGVIVTTATGVPEGYDFASRYFAPSAGLNEDPVTGSAHCFLAPYWAEKLGKTSLNALQASARTGVLDVAINGERVFISGNAVTILKSTFQLPIFARKEQAA